MSKTPIQLSDHFTCRKLICFTLPSITMMIFTAIYGVVDGFFVSNYAGKTPFAAVNLIIPVLLILGSVGFMFGTGGGALIAKTMGQGDRQRANNIFSLIVYASAACGVVLAALGFLILRPAAVLMGAEGELLEQALIYGRINLIALPFYVLQYEFQCLFATAEKPRLGLFVTVAAGVANMVLDALFVGVFSWGAAGAAAATAISQCIGGVVPLIYFARPNSSLLRLGKCRLDLRALGKTCSNGSSEFMSNVSMSLVIGSTVLVSRSTREVSELKDRLEERRTVQSELSDQLDLKNDLLSIRERAVNELGMVGEQYLNGSRLDSTAEDHLEIENGSRSGERKSGWAAILSAFGIGRD